jgi:glycosyltransferase involved in cell wall biosynthesis
MTFESRVTRAAEREFDPVYYRACYPQVLAKGRDPLAHFQKIGWKSGLNPNAHFSTKLYLAANPEVLKAGINPFDHFVESPEGTCPFVSPIFDSRFYVLNNPDVRTKEGPVSHYWSQGRKQGRPPSALFDVPFYRSQLDNNQTGIVDYLSHYLQIGWKQGLAPHPLFDPEYYSKQLEDSAKLVAPLAHYIEAGWIERLSPHPLFDSDYYAQNLASPLIEPSLVHYLKQTKWNSTPHYLFSDAYYTTAVQKSVLKGTPEEYRSGPPLLHYVRVGARHGIPPHPLFDVRHYRKHAERLVRDGDALDSVISDIERDPLRHYCEYGVDLRLSPTPLFDPEFYKSQFRDSISGDPLRHYLFPDGFSVASPHPAIDLDYYAKRKTDFLPHELPVILDLLMTPQEERISPHPSFDPKFYLERNPDVREGGNCPIEHFIGHGMKEGRQPNRVFSYPYAHRLCKAGDPQFWNPVDGYFRARGHKRPRVLFLGHDASQSGAPLVMLGLVKHVSAVSDIECITVLGSGGPLVDDFVNVSLTYVVGNQDRQFLEWNRHSPDFKAEMSTIADLVEENPPALVVCNSLESRHLADFFVSRGYRPLVSLIHEVADPYDSAQISPLLSASDLSVFVSQYQMGRMRKKVAFDESKSVVVQFGALDRWFGSSDRDAAKRKVQTELGLPDDARIVLACGTMNFRKGIDVFAEVACKVLSQPNEKDNVHFVWVGGGETHYDSAYYWADKLVRDRGIDSNVHFIGERTRTEQYYLAADLFVLTSRADPFPCVIQEAMACSLPVVAFEGTSGAAEAFGDSGVSVPFGAATMASAVEDLLSDNRRRLKLSRQAKAIHLTKNTLFSYANEVYEAVGRCAPAISKRVLAQKEPTSEADDISAVLLAVDSWDCSEASLYAEHVTKQLIKRGLNAELLFTRGPGVLKHNDKVLALPGVPFSFLYPKTQSPEHLREELIRHLTVDRGPCVFVPYSDDVSYDVIPTLPRHVATMAIVHDESTEQLERVYGLTRHFDRIVCTSAEARQDLVDANPKLKNKVVLIPTRVSIDAAKSEAQPKRTSADKMRIVCAGFSSGKLSSAVSCVKLVKLLRAEQVAFHISVFADPAEARAIRAVAPDLVRGDTMSLLESPSFTDMKEELDGSDFLVLASARDGMALLVAEAMAFGCVPIMQKTDQPPSPVIKDGENAHLVERGNFRKIAQIIRAHQLAPERLHKMSQAAQRSYRQSLSNEDVMADEYAEACRKASAVRAETERELETIRGRVHQQRFDRGNTKRT